MEATNTKSWKNVHRFVTCGTQVYTHFVIRATDKTVWFQDEDKTSEVKQERIESPWHTWHDDLCSATDQAVKNSKARVDKAQAQLDDAQATYLRDCVRLAEMAQEDEQLKNVCEPELDTLPVLTVANFFDKKPGRVYADDMSESEWLEGKEKGIIKRDHKCSCGNVWTGSHDISEFCNCGKESTASTITYRVEPEILVTRYVESRGYFREKLSVISEGPAGDFIHASGSPIVFKVVNVPVGLADSDLLYHFDRNRTFSSKDNDFATWES